MASRLTIGAQTADGTPQSATNGCTFFRQTRPEKAVIFQAARYSYCIYFNQCQANVFFDSRTLFIRFIALWAVVLFCVAAPTPLALAAMVVLGHAYFVSALGDTLRTRSANGHFWLRLLTLCVLIIGSNALWGWAHWLDEKIPHEVMALAFLSYCSYRCLLRKQRSSPQTIGSHATLAELCTLIILFTVCLSAYILLDHPVSNLAYYLFEPAYFYLWFAIHCVSSSGLRAPYSYSKNPKSGQDTTFGSRPM